MHTLCTKVCHSETASGGVSQNLSSSLKRLETIPSKGIADWDKVTTRRCSVDGISHVQGDNERLLTSCDSINFTVLTVLCSCSPLCFYCMLFL